MHKSGIARLKATDSFIRGLSAELLRKVLKRGGHRLFKRGVRTHGQQELIDRHVVGERLRDAADHVVTALAAGAATHNSRRARSGYTWATLPGTPGQKLAAKAITIAAAELVFAAWQLVWYIVEFYPVTALEDWHRRQLYGAVLPAANLYEQVVANNLFARLLPRRPAQMVILLGILILSAAMLAALDTVRGWRKLPVFASGLFCAWVCFYIVSIEQHLEWLLDEPRYAFRIAAAAVLAVLTVWWAVRSIRRGEAV